MTTNGLLSPENYGFFQSRLNWARLLQFASLCSLAVNAPLSAQTTGGFVPGGRELFAIDFTQEPIGEFPKTLRHLRGSMEVVAKDGKRALRASDSAEFLVALPEALPEHFTLEFDVITRADYSTEELAFEGTPAFNRGPASANVLWYRSDVSILGGREAGNAYLKMPADLVAEIAGQPAEIRVDVNGANLTLYTNGRRLVNMPDVKFVRGRVLRVFLGGHDTGLNAVHLSRLRIAAASTSAPAVAQQQSARTGGTTGTTATSTGLAITGITANVNSLGTASVTWDPLPVPASYVVLRWKVDDPNCCNAMSPPGRPLTGNRWQDGVLSGPGTYAYRVIATTATGMISGEVSFVYRGPGTTVTSAAQPAPTPAPEPTLTPAPIAGAQIQPGVVTMTTMAPPPAPAPEPTLSTPPLIDRPLATAEIEPRQTLRPAPAMRDVDFDNWGFEKGLTGWAKTGTAFDSQPTFGDNVGTERVLTAMEYNSGGLGGDFWKNQGYPNGYKGRFWIGTYERNPGGPGSTFGATQGDAPTGTLTSPEFQVTQAQCHFLIGGGSDATNLRVELQVRQPDGSWQVAATRTSFRNSELLHRENFPLGELQGRIARIHIVDNATGAWGHVNVDDFQFRNDVLDTITLTDAGTGRAYQVDADFPVWGIADTHAHPAHNNGFGNKLILGRAHDPLSTTYSSVQCRLHHSMLAQPHLTSASILSGDPTLAVAHALTTHLNSPFILGGDPHPLMEGWPDFVGFPRFNSKTHQQQHVEFMKRAWQGGMRLISALAVNNMYVPSLALGPGHDGQPFDDDSVTIRQIRELKEIAASQAEWMEIAYTPKDARRIIAQGKCAMVLGVEVDNFGNFKVPSYNWNDRINPANAPLTPLTALNAEDLLTRKVQEYHDLGIRQVTPLHYLTGTFGGAAVFRGQIALIQFAFNNSIRIKDAIARKIPYSLRDDYDASMIAAGVSPADYLVKIEGAATPSTMNATGMNDFGRLLMGKLMDKGMLLDSEHMGYDTKEELFALAAQRNYPVMSSHTDPSGLCYNWVGASLPFRGTREEKMRNFGTTNIRNLATEFTLADEHYEKIKRSGGTVGVFMLPYLKHPYVGPLGAVANDCAGSTKTFAQMYLYSLDKMDQQGVGLATDRGMTDFIAPRFGPQAGYMLAPETMLTVKRDGRRTQRLSQANGVRYDRPMGSFHASWYHQTDAESIDEFENDAWIAFAAIESNVSLSALPDSAYVLHGGRIRNYVRGFNARAESDLEAPTLFNGDAPWEQAAMFCVRYSKDPSALAAFRNYTAEQQNRLRLIYISIRPAWEAWNRKYGNNAPLRRFRTGNRDWDFNTDGMAHYGMMPDFLQDLRNIGIAPGNLTPLFRSAEDYIKMWEKAAQAAAPKT